MNDIVLALMYFMTMALALVALVGRRGPQRLAYLLWLAASNALMSVSKALHWFGASRHETQVLRLASVLEDIAIPMMMCWAMIAVSEAIKFRKLRGLNGTATPVR
jgi:hypothetical protein